jgi:hypothetical protein
LLCGDGAAASREATRAVLRQILLNELHQAQNADNLWFFFSGHGLSDQRDYLMPIDGNPHDLHDTAISIHFVVEQLRKCKAKNIVLILDMCRDERPDTEHKSVESVEALRQLVQAREGQQGIITLFSCGRGESSYELPGLGQGAFTHALLEGLRRQSILRDLETYLAQRVPELHRSEGRAMRKQSPLVIPEPGWKYEEPILSHSSPPVDVESVPLESEKGIDYRKLRDLLKDGKWEEADKETLHLMLIVTNRESQGWLTAKAITKFPCKDFITIDRLWLISSRGKFGFSEQVQIWEVCSQIQSSKKSWDQFCLEVGWKSNEAIDQGCYSYNNYSALHKNAVDSPRGELPYNHWISSLWGVWVGSGGASYLSALAQKNRECSSIQASFSDDDVAYTRVDVVPLESASNVNYGHLKDLLQAGKWEKADHETLKVMLKAAKRENEGWLDIQSLRYFPCQDLNTIDQLWTVASKGRFSFNVQKKIWQDCGSPITSGTDWNLFCIEVGWRLPATNPDAYVNYRGLRKDERFSPLGELPFYGLRRSDGNGADLIGVGGRCFSALMKRLDEC